MVKAQTVEWDFGDGQRGSSPLHSYAHGGAFKVRCTVSYENGWVIESEPFDLILPGDADGDGIQDYLDPDTDNDGICNGPDAISQICSAGPDALPYNPMQWQDIDGDGVGDDQQACQRLIPDFAVGAECQPDVFPLDPSEDWDNDRDGIGDNADLDDDNDGVPDLVELQYGLSPVIMDTDETVSMMVLNLTSWMARGLRLIPMEMAYPTPWISTAITMDCPMDMKLPLGTIPTIPSKFWIQMPMMMGS